MWGEEIIDVVIMKAYFCSCKIFLFKYVFVLTIAINIDETTRSVFYIRGF